MNLKNLVALVTGILFAVGLGLGGMTDPHKVQGFLDVSGRWDPSLAFVMLGAIGVHLLFARRAKPDGKPLLGGRFVLPLRTDIDARLVIGAALFGIGWGIAGLCPGPGIVSLASRGPSAFVFIGTMLAGMMLHVLFVERRMKGEASAPINVPAEARDRADAATK